MEYIWYIYALSPGNYTLKADFSYPLSKKIYVSIDEFTFLKMKYVWKIIKQKRVPDRKRLESETSHKTTWKVVAHIRLSMY
jgi:hypothetical protein